MNYKLTTPPVDDRSREIWLQHAAGFILFRDMRSYAINNIPAGADQQTRAMVIAGIDDAVYGLMMIMDRVVGGLSNEEYRVSIESNIVLERNGEIIQKIDTFHGDGMCMGYHDWKEGDFGEEDTYPIESLK